MPDALHILLAALPIIILLVLLFLRVKPLPAVIGAIAVLLVLGFWFPIDGAEALSMSGRLAYVTVNIVFILLGGLVLAVFTELSGAQKQMSRWFESAAGHRDRAVLLYGLGLTPLLESTIGWGVSLIVAIPLLLRVGLSPARSISVAVLGLVVCPWGSLAPGLILTGELGQVPLGALGVASAIYNIPVVLVMAAAIAVVGVGKRMTVRLGFELLVEALVLSGAILLVNWLLSPMLAGVLGSLAVIGAFLLFARADGARISMSREQAIAFAPISVLVVAMLIAVTITMFVDLGWFGMLITSPGLWMMVAAACAPLLFAMPRAQIRAGLGRGVRNWSIVALTTLLYIVFGVLLSVSGMSTTVATAAASNGTVFLLALPFIGTLAGYLTASVTSTATMLTLGVVEASTTIGADPVASLGVQTATTGAGVGASPARLVLGLSVVQASEGPVHVDQHKIILASIGANVLSSAIIAAMVLVLPH